MPAEHPCFVILSTMPAHDTASATSPAITLYGIPNCDTVKRARAWLTVQGVVHRFHDFKKAGVPAELPQWVAALGWEALLNRRGTTWRTVSPEAQAQVVDAASATDLMQAQPSVIKRPVVRWGDGSFSVGFDATAWTERLQRQR
jgi:arsenate reductase (glutaredoxin)